MTAQTKTSVKADFEKGDKPTEQNFIDLIDSYQDTGPLLDAFVSGASVATSGQFFITDGAGGGFYVSADKFLFNVSANTLDAGVPINANDGINVSGSAQFNGTVDVSATLKAKIIEDTHHLFVEEVTARTYEVAKSYDKDYLVTGFRCLGNGNAPFSLQKNDVVFASGTCTNVLASANVSASITTSDTFKVVTVSASGASAMGFTFIIQRRL